MYVNTLYICISLHLQNIIRFCVACIYYVSDRACLHSNSYVHSCLNNFIRILKWYFVFICLVFSYHDFISNVKIMIDSYGVFENYVFFYLCLLPLTYVSPNSYMIDWGDHVSPQNLFARTFLFSPLVRSLYLKICCHWYAHQWVRIIYICFL